MKDKLAHVLLMRKNVMKQLVFFCVFVIVKFCCFTTKQEVVLYHHLTWMNMENRILNSGEKFYFCSLNYHQDQLKVL